jgi:hypothetical protein
MPRTADPEKQLQPREITADTLENLAKELTEIPKAAREVIRKGFTVVDGEGETAVERPATAEEIVREVRKIYGRGYTLTQRMLTEHGMFAEAVA